MKRYTHKYVFYFYPKADPKTGELDKGFFVFFGRVKFGKEAAKINGRTYAYQKLF